MVDYVKLSPQSRSIDVLQSREHPAVSQPHDLKMRPDLTEYRIMLVVMTIQTGIEVPVVFPMDPQLPAAPLFFLRNLDLRFLASPSSCGHIWRRPPQTPRGVQLSIRRQNGNMLTETGYMCAINMKARPSILEMHGRPDTRGENVHAWRSCLIATPRSGRVRSAPALRRAHQRPEHREVK